MKAVTSVAALLWTTSACAADHREWAASVALGNEEISSGYRVGPPTGQYCSRVRFRCFRNTGVFRNHLHTRWRHTRPNLGHHLYGAWHQAAA